MYPRSHRLRRALRRAAELRAEGKSWDAIAEELQKNIPTVKRWPHRYADYWDRRLREADIEQGEEVCKEVVYILRDLFRKNVPDDRIKSATLLIKLLVERQKIELKAMQAGILRPNPRDDEPPEPARTKKSAPRAASPPSARG